MAWTPRQPRLDYGAADAMRELNALILGLASKHIEAKQDEEETKLELASDRLASLEKRRNTYEVAYLEKQAQIAGYTGEADNLGDLYKTGKVQGITADIYEEPFKYYEQTIAATDEQIKLLNPAIINSIDNLLRLSQAENFLTKGVGATYTTGVTEEERGTWGPEDITQDIFREKYYPELEEKALMPKPLETYFEKHKFDPGVAEGLEARRLTKLELEERVVGGVSRKQIINESLNRAGEYYPMIDESGVAMMQATFGYGEFLSGLKEKDTSMQDSGKQTFSVETFRIGLLFDPQIALKLGVPLADIKNLPAAELEKLYLTLSEGKATSSLVLDAMEIGETIFNENSQERKYSRSDIKAGIKVPLFNTRDELIAKAYMQYRENKNKISPDLAEKYRSDVFYILGIDLRSEGTVRGILRRYFRTNSVEGLTGRKGGYDKLNVEDLTASEALLLDDWVNQVRDQYYYDIKEDKWITNISGAGVEYE